MQNRFWKFLLIFILIFGQSLSAYGLTSLQLLSCDRTLATIFIDYNREFKLDGALRRALENKLWVLSERKQEKVLESLSNVNWEYLVGANGSHLEGDIKLHENRRLNPMARVTLLHEVVHLLQGLKTFEPGRLNREREAYGVAYDFYRDLLQGSTIDEIAKDFLAMPPHELEKRLLEEGVDSETATSLIEGRQTEIIEFMTALREVQLFSRAEYIKHKVDWEETYLKAVHADRVFLKEAALDIAFFAGNVGLVGIAFWAMIHL